MNKSLKIMISSCLTVAMLLSTTSIALAKDTNKLECKNTRIESNFVGDIKYIPGIGEVALAATGAIIVGGAVYEAGSWMYEKVKVWLAERNNEVTNVSERPAWTKVQCEDQAIEEAGGVKDQKQRTGYDGIRIRNVFDHETDKIIGELHYNEPEYDWQTGKSTGRKYPPHYKDKENTIDKGKGHHFYWNDGDKCY